jgi:hypothetical protein
MSLDQTTMGVLEQIIDGVIRDIPTLVKALFNPSQKGQLHIQNEHDFIFGTCLGYLYQSFSNYFASRFWRYPNQQEYLDSYC